MTFFSCIFNTIKSQDLYAKSIKLTIKGKDKLSTTYGGLMSTIIKLAILVNAVILLFVIYNRNDTKKAVNKVIKDLINDDTKHYIGKSTFGIALGYVRNSTRTKFLLDPTYFLLQIGMLTTTRNNTDYTETFVELEYERCGDNFPYDDQKTYSRVGIEDYLCLKNDDYYLSSDLNGDVSTALVFYVWKWQGDENITCKSDQEIQNVIDEGYLNIALLSSYFDFDDYENPIKTYLNDFNVLSFTDGLSQTYEIKVQENEALIADNIWYTGSYERKKFYNANEQKYLVYRPSIVKDTIAYIMVNLNRETEQYERVVYSFFDMFGYLGGLFDFLFFAGYLSVNFINEKYLNLTLLSNLYQVEKSSDEVEEGVFSWIKDISIGPKDMTPDRLGPSRILQNPSENVARIKRNLSKMSFNYMGESSFTHDPLVKSLTSKLLDRRMYSYRWVDLFPCWLTCQCCLVNKKSKHK